MARKSQPAKPRRRGARQRSRDDRPERERIIDAFMALLAEKPIEQIGFAEIAERAGVSLAELRGEFGSTLAILAAHMKELDRKVLAGGDRRHGRGAAARAAVRRADAPDRAAGAAQGGGALADALGRRNPASRWRSTPWRCARSNGC